MRIVRTIAELRDAIREFRTYHKGTIGFVPTMGFLHEGHASLLHRARQENAWTVLSIFVNPIQFGPNEDLDRYPRDEERDMKIAAEAQVDVVFLPTAAEMYPAARLTTVQVSGSVTEVLCGASRPGHFDGVATVVAKLFNLVQPDNAYFGLKDAQQVAVIEQMVQDLNIPVNVVPCDIVRESDGLALSSRNVYLNPEERSQARVLSRSLALVDEWLQFPALTSSALEAKLRESIVQAPLAVIDYVKVLHYPTLEPVKGEITIQEALRTSSLITAVAVKFGSTRLIDNRILRSKEAEQCSDI